MKRPKVKAKTRRRAKVAARSRGRKAVRRASVRKASARKAAARRAPARTAAARRTAARRTAVPRTAARRTDARGGAGRSAAKRAAGRKAAPETTLVAEAAIARATARAQASVRAELRNKTHAAETITQAAINEATEIGLLLDDDDDEEEESGASEEDAYFVKPALGPPHPRVRPAPGIEKGIPPLVTAKAKRAARGARHGTRGAPGAAKHPPTAPKSAGSGSGPLVVGDPAGAPEAAHLFPRNLRLAYPVAVRALGVWIEDRDGRRYLDGCSGAVVCSIGHGVRAIADVMSEQARRLAFTHSSQFVTRETMELSARIAALAPGDMKKTGRVYLVSGGSEAVETAIKLARQYHVERGNPGKHKVITRRQSYHGSTIGALAATGNVARREIYLPLLAETPHIAPCFCYRCPYDLKPESCAIECVDDLERAIREEGADTIAAFMAEPVVGATLGAVPAAAGYWQRAREICDRHDILLIADEVMTGVGRTGRNFAVDHYKVVPDIIVTGKGLSAGYTPLGAVIARGQVVSAIRDGRGFFEHGFTYSANPLSAAIGNAVLGYIEEHGLIARAASMGKVLGKRLEALRRHPIVGDVRGLGMMWGVELVTSRATKEPFPPALKLSRRLYEACIEEGLIIYPGSGTRDGRDGDHFIIAPPFTITREEMEEMVARLERGLTRVAAAAVKAG